MTPRPKKEQNPKKDPIPKQNPNPKKEPKPKPTKNSFAISIYLTTSKILGYVIFVVGSVFAFVYKEPDIFIFSSSIAAGLLGLKTWQSAALERKRMEYGDNGYGGYGGHGGYGGYDNGYGGNGYDNGHGGHHGGGSDYLVNNENESDIPPPPPVGGGIKPSDDIG